MKRHTHNRNNSFLIASTFTGLLLITSTVTRAQDVGLNAWGMEFAPITEQGIDHMAFYPGMSLSFTYEVGPWALSPSLGLEWAADATYWDIMAMLYADHPINDNFGFDIILAAMHDQEGDNWTNAEMFLGAGSGLSWLMNDRAVLTPNVLLYYGLRTNTWALAPGVNLWVSLENE